MQGIKSALKVLLTNRFMFIILNKMDVRLKKEEENLVEMTSDKLTDSLIYNIIKKIELKMSM